MNRSVYKSIKKERKKQNRNKVGEMGPIKRKNDNPIEALFKIEDGFYRWDESGEKVQMELKFANDSGVDFFVEWIVEKTQKFTETHLLIDGFTYDITEGLDRIIAMKFSKVDKKLVEAYVEYTNSQRSVRHVLVFLIQRMVLEKLAERVKERIKVEKVRLMQKQEDKEVLEWEIVIEGAVVKVSTHFVINEYVIEMDFVKNEEEQEKLMNALEQTLPEGVEYRRLISNLKNEFREVAFGREMLLAFLIEQFEQTEFYQLRSIFDQTISQRYKWLKRAAVMNY